MLEGRHHIGNEQYDADTHCYGFSEFGGSDVRLNQPDAERIAIRRCAIAIARVEQPNG